MIGEPTGTHPLAEYLRRMAQEVNASVLTSVVGGRFQRGPGGTQLFIDAGQGGAASGGIQVAKITSVAGLATNYIEAKLADFRGGSESLAASAVKVALPPLLWEAEKPTSSVSGYTFEREPAYAVNDYIAVASVPQGTGVEVSDVQVVWQDVTVGRAWAVKLPICIDGIIHYQLTHGGSITST